MEDRETPRMCKYGESKTTRMMMATVPHVTSGSGLRKFQADGFFSDRVYHLLIPVRLGSGWVMRSSVELTFSLNQRFYPFISSRTFCFVTLSIFLPCDHGIWNQIPLKKPSDIIRNTLQCST